MAQKMAPQEHDWLAAAIADFANRYGSRIPGFLKGIVKGISGVDLGDTDEKLRCCTSAARELREAARPLHVRQRIQKKENIV
jgi:hypothetical protein